MDKSIFFGYHALSPWVVLATWLYQGVLQKLHKKWIKYKKNKIFHNFCIRTWNCSYLIFLGL
jgi:hypothetical protein